MNKKEIKEAMIEIIHTISFDVQLYLIKQQKKDPSVKNPNYQTKSLLPIDVCKSVLMYFYKAWYTLPTDLDTMSTVFENLFKTRTITKDVFYQIIIHSAVDLEAPSLYDAELYPPIFFDSDNNDEPYYIHLF